MQALTRTKLVESFPRILSYRSPRKRERPEIGQQMELCPVCCKRAPLSRGHMRLFFSFSYPSKCTSGHDPPTLSCNHTVAQPSPPLFSIKKTPFPAHSGQPPETRESGLTASQTLPRIELGPRANSPCQEKECGRFLSGWVESSGEIRTTPTADASQP